MFLPTLLSLLSTTNQGQYVYPDVCYADTRIVRERLWHAVHDWSKYKDTDAVACQIEVVLRTGSYTPYQKCVEGFTQKELGALNDQNLVKTGRGIKELRTIIKKTLEKKKYFLDEVAKCAHDIKDCQDVMELRECMIHNQNPYVA